MPPGQRNGFLDACVLCAVCADLQCARPHSHFPQFPEVGLSMVIPGAGRLTLALFRRGG